jgi:four helix bundle protein
VLSAEVRSQLYVALDVGYIEQVKFNQLLNQAEEVGKIIGGLRISVSKQKDQKNSAPATK